MKFVYQREYSAYQSSLYYCCRAVGSPMDSYEWRILGLETVERSPICSYLVCAKLSRHRIVRNLVVNFSIDIFAVVGDKYFLKL